MAGNQAEAAVVRRCWKHSRQKTGRPCVGLKGTVVSLPQPEQLVRVSTLGRMPGAAVPIETGRLALQALQRLGSFLNSLSRKNSCSPAVKTKSAPQSIHFKTLSWNSMESCSLQPATPSHGRWTNCNSRQDRTERPSRSHKFQCLGTSPRVRPSTRKRVVTTVKTAYGQMKFPTRNWEKLRAAMETAARPLISPALYVPSCDFACAPALLSRAFFRPA